MFGFLNKGKAAAPTPAPEGNIYADRVSKAGLTLRTALQIVPILPPDGVRNPAYLHGGTGHQLPESLEKPQTFLKNETA